MPRVNVWLSDEQFETLRMLRRVPGFKLSRLLQKAIEDTLDCHHDQLQCARCGCQVDQQYLVSIQVTRFYRDARFAIGELVLRGGGTAEGAQRVLQDVAKLWHGRGLVHWDAAHAPLDRPSRSVREAIWQRAQAWPKTPRQLAAEAAETERRAQLAGDEEIA